MDARKLLEFWNKNLPEKVDYASLVCAEGFASGFKYVYEDEYGYVVEDTIKELEKLADYEDLEEQGLLLRLPCKVGDVVYVISERKIYSGVVCDYIKSLNHTSLTVRYDIVNPFYTDGRIMKRQNGFRINERVFLTREQAEQKLKELQEGEKKDGIKI